VRSVRTDINLSDHSYLTIPLDIVWQFLYWKVSFIKIWMGHYAHVSLARLCRSPKEIGVGSTHHILTLDAQQARDNRQRAFQSKAREQRIILHVRAVWYAHPRKFGTSCSQRDIFPVYAVLTDVPPVFVLYDSPFWSCAYLLLILSVSVWNGGGFYIEVFGRKCVNQCNILIYSDLV
jgi:hypothetical protein